MRIISGSLRRRAIRVPRGESVRPTTDRIREAIFNILASRTHIAGARVLDLFAGSGALGLEAISRGAAAAVFVEEDRHAARIIRENVEQLGVADSSTVVVEDAIRFLDRNEGAGFDLVFADPPYDFNETATLPDRALRVAGDSGLLILEHEGRDDFSRHECLLAGRSYGRTRIDLFTRNIEHEQPE